MIKNIKGLYHITSMAADARQNNSFFTDTLGLRRVKKTVNFDAPEVYHLYYGDEDTAHLGQALKLPTRYEPHRAQIEGLLPSLEA